MTPESLATIAGRVLADVATGQPVQDPRTEGALPMTETPSRYDLFRQAGGDGDEYRRLCHEQGIEPDGPPKVMPGSSGLPGPAWPDHSTISADTAAALKPGDMLRVFLDSGEEQQLVVVADPKVDVDGTVRFEVADPERVAAMERIASLAASFENVRDAVATHHVQALDRHADAAEAAGADVRFEFADEPHHAAARLRTPEEQGAAEGAKYSRANRERREARERADGERAALAPRLAMGGVVSASPAGGDMIPATLTGCTASTFMVKPPSDGACCQAAYDSDGFAHDHEVPRG